MEFSSTETYANRYDLDEIDVLLEGDSSNPMFFSVTGLPDKLTFGKHYFNLSILNPSNQKYRLRNGSKILFEFKSINNVVLQSDVVEINQRNGVIIGYVNILKNPLGTYKEVEDGEGTLTVVGSLGGSGIKIPEKFRKAMNYRCTWPIDIRKNLINATSPRILQSEHKTTTTLGFFSFAKASISTRRGATAGNKYGDNGLVSDAHVDPPAAE